jgi:hypothetical protein
MADRHAVVVRAGKLPFHRASALETLERNLTLTNVGNLLFQHAFIRAIYEPDLQLISVQDGLLTDAALDRINSTCDAVYLPFANAFRLSFRKALQNWTTNIRKLKVPVVVVGIGAQCTTGDPVRELAEMNDDVRRFCRAVLERSTSIGVRGLYTHDYLRRLGIRDVDVVGCPSMFWHGSTLPQPLPARLQKGGKIAFHFSPQSPSNLGSANPHVERQLQALLGLLMDLPDAQCTYIAQDTNELTERIWGVEGVTLSRVCPLLKGIATVYPIDPHVWIRDLTTYDFSVGTRIHGAIAAVQAGIPSAIFCHDSRTRELAQWFKLPFVDFSGEPAEPVTPEYLADLTDGSAMHKVYASRYHTYVSFLERNGVPHQFDTLAGGNPHWGTYEQSIAAMGFAPTLDNQTTPASLIDEKVNALFRMLHRQQAALSRSGATAA